MKRFGHIGLTPVLLLSAALLMRAAVPAGYMPASAGSGLLFELCPENVPAEFMQMLAGERDRHHHHADHGNDGHHCPMGHMLLSAFAVDDHWQPDFAPTPPDFAAIPTGSFTAPYRTTYHSRGPPA